MTVGIKKIMHFTIPVLAVVFAAGCATNKDLAQVNSVVEELRAEAAAARASAAQARAEAASARTTSAEARMTAETASKEAEKAVSRADSAATTANRAVSTAESAESKSRATESLAGAMKSNLDTAVEAAKTAELKSYEALSAAEGARSAAFATQAKALEAQASGSEAKGVAYRLKAELTSGGMIQADVKDPSAVPVQERFMILVGSYASSSQAEQVRSRLESGGHQVVVDQIDAYGITLNNVRIGPFDNRVNAQRVLNRALKQGYNASLIPLK
jgi:cell division protein FtsN